MQNNHKERTTYCQSGQLVNNSRTVNTLKI